MKPFCSIPEAIYQLQKGRMLIVVDHPKRENQGDIIFPAETVTVEKVNFLLQECRGMICVAITNEQAVRLDLPLMVELINNTESTHVKFTVTVDAKNVASFGISAKDRAETIKVLSNINSSPADLVRPGHVFPLLGNVGGILERPGHTEAAITLARLAGFAPCGVLCEILKRNGEVAHLPDLVTFANKFHIPLVTISDLSAYVKSYPLPKDRGRSLIKKSSAKLPTKFGIFDISVYKSILDGREHTSLGLGNLRNNKPILTRIHSQCLTGDTLFSLKCDCQEQLYQSMRLISEKKCGVIIYLNQEGRGIGLSNKIRAYALQDKGYDTVEANLALHLPIDARDYQIAAEILKDQSITKITLLTNNPTKIEQLNMYGITVVDTIPVEVLPSAINRSYLRTKKQKLGHRLTIL